MEEIIRMQENLLLIRRTVGWTAEEFGEKIGVTRQTINNIESGAGLAAVNVWLAKSIAYGKKKSKKDKV